VNGTLFFSGFSGGSQFKPESENSGWNSYVVFEVAVVCSAEEEIRSADGHQILRPV